MLVFKLTYEVTKLSICIYVKIADIMFISDETACVQLDICRLFRVQAPFWSLQKQAVVIFLPKLLWRQRRLFSIYETWVRNSARSAFHYSRCHCDKRLRFLIVGLNNTCWDSPGKKMCSNLVLESQETYRNVNW